MINIIIGCSGGGCWGCSLVVTVLLDDNYLKKLLFKGFFLYGREIVHIYKYFYIHVFVCINIYKCIDIDSYIYMYLEKNELMMRRIYSIICYNGNNNNNINEDNNRYNCKLVTTMAMVVVMMMIMFGDDNNNIVVCN